MDRNTIIGFVLLALLLFLYLFLSTKNSQDLAKQRKQYEDSLAALKLNPGPAKPADTIARAGAPAPDTAAGLKSLSGQEVITMVESDLFRIAFTNKGGQPKAVYLKKYETYDGQPVMLVSGQDHISYPVNTGANQSSLVSKLYFNPPSVSRRADGSQLVVYDMPGANGALLRHQFVVYPDNYAIDWSIVVNGVDNWFTQSRLNLNWHAEPMQQQKDVEYERQLSNVVFAEDNDFDYISSRSSKAFESPVQWVGVSQQFFSNVLLAKSGFTSGEVHWTREAVDTSRRIAEVDANVQATFPGGASSAIHLQLFYGPNDYNILKNQAPEMSRIVNLGRDFYSFVRPINVYIIMPVFNFFKQFIASYGVVILLLTLFIRLLTSPLIYKSYLSGAKMKVLRPEMEALRKKYGDDQQQYGMEQMKLFREAGVNPLGGCIPALLQIPIFFALYSFFNSNIALRGESFLWAKDLSVYDSILNLPFSIPFYGSHVSLFTLLAVVTSFLISWYGMANAPDQGNPALKYMPYIFPVLLLGFFNKLPSALTWYYTVSNVITLILQWIIQTYIIDHDKILAKIEENKKRPKTKSKWQERIEQMQQTQQRGRREA